MPVSLVATVYNEAPSLGNWLASIDAQVRPPDEVVIVDAGSIDGTIERLRAWAGERPQVRVVVEPGCNVPEGRNRAIAAAGGPLIAVCDAGTVLDPHWLGQLVAPLEEDHGVGVSGGFFRPAGETPFERVLATVVTPRLPEVDPDRFLPSSRSIAFHKDWWERSGGYPEWLRAGEDLVFDFALKEAGARMRFVPGALVWWSPHASLRGFFWQYWHYARGDGHAHLWPWRHAARYGSYGLGVALLVLTRRRPAALALLAAGVAVHMRRYVWRVLDERPLPGAAGTATALALVPVVVVTGDVAKMLGYPRGVWERRQAGEPERLKGAPIESHRRPGRRGIPAVG